MTKTRNKLNSIIGAAIAKASAAAVGQSNNMTKQEKRPVKYLDVITKKRTSSKHLIRQLKQLKRLKREEKLAKGMRSKPRHTKLQNHQIRKWELLYRQIGLEYAP